MKAEQIIENNTVSYWESHHSTLTEEGEYVEIDYAYQAIELAKKEERERIIEELSQDSYNNQHSKAIGLIKQMK